MFKPTSDYIEGIVKEGKRVANYKSAYDKYKHLSFHIDGYEYNNKIARMDNPYFQFLIDNRRPSESEEIKKYRREIYRPITKMPCFKVLNSLKKIVKSREWVIDYAGKEPHRRVLEQDSLFRYCEKEYPLFGSIESWFYNYAIKEVLTDPNCAIVVLPQSYDLKGNEYLKPFANVIHCDKIYDYKPNEYIIFESNNTSEYTAKNGSKFTAPIICIVTTESIYEATKADNNNHYTVEEKYKHNIGELPCVIGGGLFESIISGVPLYDSFISPMLPYLDIAARESSDMDAEVVQHIYSTMWYLQGDNCNVCAGMGKVKKAGKQVVCPECSGAGVMAKSPYRDIILKKGAFDNTNIPTPPAGYVSKPTEIVRLQDERISKHITNALSSINMEFLASSPLNQSGLAKEVDKEELNNFVYGVAYHFIENVIKPVYYFTAMYRYNVVEPNKEKIKEMLPRIPVPEQFDLLSEDVMVAQIKAAKDASMSGMVVNEMEVDFINKKFRDNSKIRERLLAINAINPFQGKSSEEIVNMAFSNNIDKKDAYVALHITKLINEAETANKNFYEMDRDKQRQIVYAIADKYYKAPIKVDMPDGNA